MDAGLVVLKLNRLYNTTAQFPFKSIDFVEGACIKKVRSRKQHMQKATLKNGNRSQALREGSHTRQGEWLLKCVCSLSSFLQSSLQQPQG